MKKIRVLQIGLHTNRGGIETVVHSWWQHMPQEEVAFDFLNVWDAPIAFQDEFEAKGAKILHKCLRKNNPGKSYEELKRIIIEGNYDFVHCHSMSLSEPEPVEIADAFSNARAILHSHTAATKDKMGLKRYLLHLYGKKKLAKYHYLKIACGTEAGQAMFGSDDFTIIENGVDRNRFRYSTEYRSEIRKKYGIGVDEFVIGHVGRQGKVKNYPFLIKVFSEFRKLCDARLILIGDVENDRAVQRLIDSSKVRDYVIFTGKVRDVYKYYSAMDVFLFPSLYEGLSVSLIEAQSTGLPCIVSRNVDRESAVSDAVAFIDIDKMEDALKELGKCYGNRNVDRNKVSFDEAYDIKQSSIKMLEYYKSMRK